MSDLPPSTVLTLLLATGVAFLGVRALLDRIEGRLPLSSSVDLLLLGALLGPLTPGLRVDADLAPLAPVIALTLGWVGLRHGLALDLRQAVAPQDTPQHHAFRVALLDALVTGTGVTLAAWWFLGNETLGSLPAGHAWLAAGTLGAAAVAGSTSALEVLRRRGHDGKGLLGFLGRTTRIGSLLGICAFGALFALFHQGVSAPGTPQSPGDWILVTLGLGLGLGLLSALFLGEDTADDRRPVSLLALVTLAAGVALYLDLSILLVCLVLGVVLANTRVPTHRPRQLLAWSHHPMRVLLLVLAATLWTPAPLVPTALGVGGFLALRLLGKTLSCWIASHGTPLRADLARGLFAQGEVTIAIALSLTLVYEGAAIDWVASVLLLSVVASELLAPPALQGLLIDAGEIRGAPRSAAGGS